MKKILFIIAILSIIGLACTDLDEELYEKIPGDEYPENEAQIATLPVDAYAKMKPLVDDEGWWFLAQEISGDGLCGPTRDADWFDGGKWINVHTHEWTTDDESVNRMWDVFWQGITRSNQILDVMKGLQQTEEIAVKIDEVETIRSFYYYLLLDNYGDAPYLTTSDDVPDEPYKISREAIYDSLITTLEENLSSLKLIDNKYLATRYMAFSLLAKLYLNAEVYTGTANWVKADAYIDSVLAGPYSLATNMSAPFVTDNENSPEIIFSIPYDEDDFQGFRLHMRTLHYQHNLTYDMPVGPWNGFAITPNHFDNYEEGDIRKEEWMIYGPQYNSAGGVINDGETGTPLVIDPYLPALSMSAGEYTPAEIRMTGARIGKYEIKMGAKENLSNDFPLFRITDFYLMKAETQIRLNGAGSGDNWINPIRSRAGVDTWSGATLDDLLGERGRELWCEGHRRQDLIRYDEFTKVWWAKGDDQGGTSGDPSVETFPIPKWATDANPNLLLDPQ